MKKVASLLLIFTLVLSMGIGAFAAEDPTALHGSVTGNGRNTRGTSMSPGTTINPFEVEPRDTAIDQYSNEDGVFDDTIGFAPTLTWTANENEVSIGAGEMFLVQSNRIVPPDAQLIPNTEYVFEVWFNNGPALSAVDISGPINATATPTLIRLTEAHIVGSTTPLTNGRLRIRSGRGSASLSNTNLRTRGTGVGRTYELEVETRETYTTRLTDTTLTLLTSGTLPPVTGTNENPAQSTVNFVVGFLRMDADEIDTYSEGDTVTLSNERPVIMRREMDRLVRNHNFRAIHLEFDDGSWEFTGRMSGMRDTNFFTTQDAVPAIMNRLDQDFKFLSLPAGVTFPANGEMRIDVSDVSEDWNTIYTYLFRNGTLTPISTNYDSMDDMIYFRTNFLGTFVMTDVEITDTNILNNNNNENNNNNVETPAPEEPNVNNPATGVAMGLNSLLMGLGTVSLLGAGALVTRRKK